VCGTLGEVYGWHYGFAAAGVGMVCGLVVYTWGARYLPSQVVQARTVAERARAEQAKARRTSDPGEGDLVARFSLLVAVVAAVVVFRGAYEQLGNTLALWADTGVDRRVAGDLSIPMTWFQSINPLVVFLLTPVFLARWAALAAKGREASTLVKMALGAAIVGGSYLAIGVVSLLAERAGVKASWIWLVAFLAVLTAGELYILPVGLGLFGRLAPPRLTAFTIAVWFFAISFGNALAGWLGSFWSRLTHAEFFALVGAVSLTSGALLLVLDRPMRRLEAGAETELAALHLET
jgi:POT family proton-dependent oligopeptide transporter